MNSYDLYLRETTMHEGKTTRKITMPSWAGFFPCNYKDLVDFIVVSFLESTYKGIKEATELNK